MAIQKTNTASTSFEELTLNNLIDKISEGQSDGAKNLISCLPPTQRIPAYAILLGCEVKAENLPKTIPNTTSKVDMVLKSFNPLNGEVTYKFKRVGERVYNRETDKYDTKPCEPKEGTDSCGFETWLSGDVRG